MNLSVGVRAVRAVAVEGFGCLVTLSTFRDGIVGEKMVTGGGEKILKVEWVFAHRGFLALNDNKKPQS